MDKSLGVLCIPDIFQDYLLDLVKIAKLEYKQICSTDISCILSKNSNSSNINTLLSSDLRTKILITYKYSDDEVFNEKYVNMLGFTPNKLIYIQNNYEYITMLTNYDSFFLSPNYNNSFINRNNLKSFKIKDCKIKYIYYLISKTVNNALAESFEKHILNDAFNRN